jgi:hypothetical protein
MVATCNAKYNNHSGTSVIVVNNAHTSQVTNHMQPVYAPSPGSMGMMPPQGYQPGYPQYSQGAPMPQAYGPGPGYASPPASTYQAGAGRFCVNCGTQNGEGAKFCQSCGSSTGTPVSAPSPVYAAPGAPSYGVPPAPVYAAPQQYGDPAAYSDPMPLKQ